MKNKLLYITVFLVIFTILGFSYISSNNKSLTLSADTTSSLRTKYEEAVVETAYQYYYRGRALQYDAINLNYEYSSNAKYTGQFLISKNYKTQVYKTNGMNPLGMYSPEQATDQDYHFLVCSHFTFNVYAETFVHSNNEKYQITSKSGAVKMYTAELNAIANKDDTTNYRKDITILSLRETDSYKFKDHADSVQKQIIDAIRPGDLFVYGSGDNSSGHVMLYVGDDTILHSSGGAPKAYSSVGTKINDYGVSGAKYHLESKADMIDTESGTFEVDTDKTGTVKKSALSTYIKKYVTNNASNKVLSVLRPLNEIISNSDIKLSSNSENRLKKKGLSLTKKASVEKYDSVNLGDSIKYTITVENKSNTNYSNISIYDEVPKYTSLKSLSETCKENNGKITCSVNVNAGQKVSIYYNVSVIKNMNYLGKTIESNKGKVNNIPLKEINTKINKTLTNTERSNISRFAKEEKGKSYQSIESFISTIYKKLNYNINILSPEELFNNFYVKSNYKLTKSNNAFNKRTLHNEGDIIQTYDLKKNENISENYKSYYNTFVEGLFGGVATTYQNEKGAIHYRNVAYTTKTLIPGDVLYVYDSNIANDNISLKGGYVIEEKNAYLYLGDGEFATLDNGKVYIYDKSASFDYYMYTPDRSKIEKIDFTGIRKVSIGERLLTSLIGQDSFIVLRPSYNISEKLTGIVVTTMPTKTSYIQNAEDIVLTGGKLKLIYGSYGTKTIDLDNKDVTVTNFDNSKIGKTTATINYKGLKTTISVNIVAKSLVSVSVKKKPTKINYVQNSEELDLTGGILLAKYDDNSTSEISMTSSSVNVSGFSNTKVGVVKVTLDYLGKKTTIEINVISQSVESISLISKPNKIEYLEKKEALDLTGSTLRLKYNDGTIKDIKLPNNEVNVIGFDNSKVGTNTITLSYGIKSTKFEVTILSKSLIDISINELPQKLSYIQNSENLDLTTGSIKLKYDNDEYEIINLSSPNIKISGFDNSTVGTNSIKVNYLGKVTTFEVKIISNNNRKVNKIEIDKLPTKINYTQNKEILDLSGGKIRVEYSDGTSEIVSMKSSNVIVSGFNNSNSGKNKITISYLNNKTSFEVNIKKRSVKKVKIKEEPTKVTYSDNEELDLSGGLVEVQYTDNTKEEISLDSPNIKVSNINTENEEDTIVVDYYGEKDSFKVKVTKILSIFDELMDTDDDFDVNYSEYGEFYDAVKMKPNEVLVSIGIIFGLSIILYFMMRKVK